MLHSAPFALAVISLADDIELNPGYQTFDDMKTTMALKIAHLNIRSLKNKTDSLSLEGIDIKSFDVLTSSETCPDDTTNDAEIELPEFVYRMIYN